MLIAVLMEPYRMARLTSFINPGADAAGAGFQGQQASIALGSGGIFGVGIGESVQKAFYLPEAHTDMIAAVIGEELGLIGISLLVGLYMLFGYAGFRTAQKARDRYGRLLAAGLTAMILVQASINLFAVLGLAPLTGVTLPFVSYGNSSLIVTLAAVGLLLNVANGGSARMAAAGVSRRLQRRRRRPRQKRPALPAAPPHRGERLVRVVIAAGGTAGHVVPALAVADALAERGAEVSFVGTRDRAEAELVPAAGYEIDFLDVTGIDRRNPLRAARGARPGRGRRPRRPTASSKARGADAVMGGGGYVAAPTGIAAAAMRLPLVLTEADSHLGLANRLLAPRARRVCLAFPIEGRDGDRYLVTGRPVPAAIGQRRPGPARERFGIEPDVPCLLIFGGSLGALRINRAAADRVRRRAGRPPTGRSTSSTSPAPATTRRSPPISQGASRYTLLEYLPDLADALAASDLVLSRSGGSVFELTAAGRPASSCPTRTPRPATSTTNARWMEQAGAADGRRGRGPRRRSAASPRSRPLLADRARLRADGRRLARASPSPTPPTGSPTRSSPRPRRRDHGVSRRIAAPLHFIAIGGAGMSGLALVCDRLGHRVTGSDRAESPYVERLRAAGIEPVDRPRRRPGPRRRGGRRLDGHPRRQRRARARPRARPERHPPQRPAGAGLRRQAADRGRRRPRQDDDRGNDRPRPRGRRGRSGLPARRRAARRRDRPEPRPTPTGGAPSGSSPRPTRATAAS